jgi:hypothetical protein
VTPAIVEMQSHAALRDIAKSMRDITSALIELNNILRLVHDVEAREVKS